MSGRFLLLLVTSMLISCSQASKAEFSEKISNIEREMRHVTYNQLKKCSKTSQRECNLQLALNSMDVHNKLKDKLGEQDYEKAEQYLMPITGTSLAARMLLGEILMHEGKRKEAMALVSSSGTEEFAPALDQLVISNSLLYAEQSQEFMDFHALKWQYKYYEQRKDPDIAYYIAAHFITPRYQDCSAAVQWFAKATEGHNANINAQHLLGEQYEAGNCVPQDYVMAYMMYDLGGTAAAEQKHTLAKKMTPEQINEGIMRSHQWQDENHSYRVGYGSGTPIYWNVHTSDN